MASERQGGWDFVGGGLGEFLEVDTGPTVRTYDPEHKMWIDKPLRGEPFEALDGQVFPSKWHHDAHVSGLRRNVEACDHHLAHLDDPTPWWAGEPPSSEQRERRRAELENEKTAVLAELVRLGEDVDGLMPKAKQTTKKK
jgi:hypothetical protein